LTTLQYSNDSRDELLLRTPELLYPVKDLSSVANVDATRICRTGFMLSSALNIPSLLVWRHVHHAMPDRTLLAPMLTIPIFG